MQRLATKAAMLAVRRYRATKRPVRCRRQGPSCSAYMLAQLEEHGLVLGLERGLVYIRDHSLLPADVDGRMVMALQPTSHPCFASTATAAAIPALILAEGEAGYCGEGYCSPNTSVAKDACGNHIPKTGSTCSDSWSDSVSILTPRQSPECTMGNGSSMGEGYCGTRAGGADPGCASPRASNCGACTKVGLFLTLLSVVRVAMSGKDNPGCASKSGPGPNNFLP